MLVTLLALCALAASGNTLQGTSEAQTPDIALATGFDVSTIDLSSAILRKGAVIFKSIDPSCFLQRDLQLSSSEFKSYESTRDILNSFGVSAGITPSFLSLFSLKLSLNGMINKQSGSNLNVRGTSLVLYSHASTQYLQKSCRLEFDEEFLSDFRNLDGVVGYPEREFSWRNYRHFISKYGSHFVSEVTLGASITQHTFAQSSMKYSNLQLKAKACLGLAGPVQGGVLGIEACGGINRTSLEASRSMDTSDKLTAKGGTDRTRHLIIDARHRSPRNIRRFLTEGRSHPSPVSYKFESVADLLERNFTTTKFANQSANLNSYIKGFLNFGCSYNETNDLLILQRFERDLRYGARVPHYKCTVEEEGCNSDTDCHYHKRKFRCACDGPTCVSHIRDTLTPGKIVARIRQDSDVVPGCSYSFPICRCPSPRPTKRRVVWSSFNTVHNEAKIKT